MRLEKILLQNFRCFEQIMVDLHPKLTFLYGQNTKGKTSVMEAIHVLLQGTGFRESSEEELIRWNQTQAIIGATAILESGDRTQLQCLLREKGLNEVSQSSKVEKAFFIDKVKKTYRGYSPYVTRAVLFTPDNIEILTGSPTRRRTYFDSVLGASSLEYRKRQRNYESSLRKRNKLLEKHTNPMQLQEELGFWNAYVAEQGRYLTQERQKYISYLNNTPKLDERTFRIEYIPNPISVELLEARFEKECLVRRTMIGPQKDDYIVYRVDPVEKNVSLYGSRSEQRLALFWLKQNEIRFLEETLGKKPLLLLDDVFSELDPENKHLVLRTIQNYQTVVTTTETELIEMIGNEREIIRL